MLLDKVNAALALWLGLGLGLAGIAPAPSYAAAYEIEVLGGVDEAVAFWKAHAFWGEEQRGSQLTVPRIFTVAINKSWRNEAQAVTVGQKKELFYRALLPLILLSNEHIASDRSRLLRIHEDHREGASPTDEDLGWLRALAVEYKVVDGAAKEASREALLEQLPELVSRVDVVPPALALGQGAYESGYGTSRFALHGNSLFGMWTWGGKGMKPLQQRSGKGDYRVASYLWPFDSVRAYMQNLNTQRAYSELRAKRAQIRSRGAEPTGLDLVPTLIRYSERGQAYVDTLRGIIRTNILDIADDAVLGEGPTVLLVQAEDGTDKPGRQAEIEALRASGELSRLIDEMDLRLE